MGEYRKIHILIIISLTLTVGLFFYLSLSDAVWAKKPANLKKPTLEILDPLEKIGKSSLAKKETEPKICADNSNIYEFKKPASAESYYHNLVKGHPIEAMIPAISKRNKAEAAFLIGIAKKESNWGKRSPKKNGQECYNYWGYRGGENPTDSGYSCFDSPEQAVMVVGGRIAELIGQKINTPERMIVWKCGRTCAGHDEYSVKKWISDVRLYYNKLNS